MKNDEEDGLIEDEVIDEIIENDRLPDGINYRLPEPTTRKVDVSDQFLERRARGFLMGSARSARQREVKQDLEEKVVKRIGVRGKYLTDKLFELIEGIYVIDKHKMTGNQEIRYYKVPPSLPAIMYALDRVLGKPGASTGETKEKQGVRVVEEIIRGLAGETTTRKTVELTKEIE